MSFYGDSKHRCELFVAKDQLAHYIHIGLVIKYGGLLTMTAHNFTSSGTYDLPGVYGNDVTVNPGLIINFNLTSTNVDTFSVSSNAGSVVTMDSTSALSDVINLETNGGTVVLGTGLVNTLTAVQATVDGGGTYQIEGDLISHLNGGTISFQGTGGTNIIGSVAKFSVGLGAICERTR